MLDWLRSPPFLWQMRLGERLALEGILSRLQPALSIEIGTAGRGSLSSISAHSRDVHSFDIDPGVVRLREQFPNVVFHVGDSAEVVPAVLQKLADEGRSVDFALVDGDHSPEGVRRDAQALLDSDACKSTVIVFHDAANEEVRAGLDAVASERHPKVALVSLDFVPGYVVRDGVRRHEIWNGLALVVLGQRVDGGALADADVYPAAQINREMRDIFDRGPQPEGGGERRADLDREVTELNETIRGMQQTRVWRMGAAWWRLRDRLLRRAS